jgi:PAS domain-containing protein
MPALVLLNRLPTPMLAVGLGGDLVYANPALATALGYPDVGALAEQSLPVLMSGHAKTSAADCVTVLREGAGSVTDWCHLDGYLVRTVVSDALLTRATDPLLLITLTDVSDLHWS